VRLFLRLNADVNERLRVLLRYQGELSRYINQALVQTDLSRVDLIAARPGKRTPGLTAVVSAEANSSLRCWARKRGCSITVLANSALFGWLERGVAS
jgi:hypothetical protein